MVEEMLAERGIIVSHETVRQWGLKFGQAFANRIRRPANTNAADHRRNRCQAFPDLGRDHRLGRCSLTRPPNRRFVIPPTAS